MQAQRTPGQIARQALSEAKAAGVIRDYSARKGGRATIYYASTSDKAGLKCYTTSVLDTLTVLRDEGFEPGADREQTP